MSNKIIVKKVNEPMQLIEVNEKYRNELKKYVIDDFKSDIAAAIEPVFMAEGIQLLTDENGYRKELKHNFYLATENEKFPIQTIIGTVVFAKFKPFPIGEEPYDYELDTITETDFAFIEQMFDNGVQQILKDEFDTLYDGREYWTPIVEAISE